jgi:hypothetical protein
VSALSVAALVLLVAGCYVQIQKVTAQKPESYKFLLQDRGFRVSADPYKEASRLDECFGYDLVSRGILPVLVVIENHDAASGYNLLPEDVRLLLKDTNPNPSKTEVGAVGPPVGEVRKGGARGMATTSDVLTYAAALGSIVTPLAPALVIPALAFGAAANKQEVDAQLIRDNLEDKRLVSRTLYPGSTQAGFLYFKLDNEADIRRVHGIRINMKNVRSDEVLSLSVNIRDE